MFRKVLKIPLYFDENAHSKNSNNSNAVITNSSSSKYQKDYIGTFQSHWMGQHSNLRVVLRRATQCSYAELRSAATQSCYAELRCAPQSYAELHRATLSYEVLRCAMPCYAVSR